MAAAPDALSVRFKASDVLPGGQWRNLWGYSGNMLRELGWRGVFRGWGMSCAKESLGYGLFFATFEYVKAQVCYRFIAMYYGNLRGDALGAMMRRNEVGGQRAKERIIRPHYAIEPAFLALAGVSASLAQQLVAHPVGKFQDIHYRVLQSQEQRGESSQKKMQEQAQHGAYAKTFRACASRAKKSGGWRRWLYRGFWWNTLRQVPSTAAGLVIFELVRKRYGDEAEAVRIEEDGYDILLR